MTVHDSDRRLNFQGAIIKNTNPLSGATAQVVANDWAEETTMSNNCNAVLGPCGNIQGTCSHVLPTPLHFHRTEATIFASPTGLGKGIPLPIMSYQCRYRTLHTAVLNGSSSRETSHQAAVCSAHRSSETITSPIGWSSSSSLAQLD